MILTAPGRLPGVKHLGHKCNYQNAPVPASQADEVHVSFALACMTHSTRTAAGSRYWERGSH